MYKATGIIHGNIANSKLKIEIFSPINNEKIGEIPCLTEEQINESFQSAEIALDIWKPLEYKLKQKYMFEFIHKLEQNKNLIIELVKKETGKSHKESLEEFERSIKYINETIHEFGNLIENPKEFNFDNCLQMPKELTATYLKIPWGVALTISPFNYPLNLMITKIVPAILMGNTVVHKSSTQGSLVGWYVAKIFNDLVVENYPIPPGVLNFITGKGSEISKSLSKQVNVSALSFTGSTIVGLEVSKYFPQIPKQLEMAGLNVAIVLKDAYIKNSVKLILKGAFTFSGQRCTAIKKVLVEKSIADKFQEELMYQLKEYEVDYSPLINKNSVNQVKAFYEDARINSGQLLTKQINWNEFNDLYIPPIIFKNISKDAALFKEEVFGPMLAVIEFNEIGECIEMANNTEYGLQTSIFTDSLEIATNMAHQLDFGRININLPPSRSPDILPFCAVKKSGLSNQGIIDSLLFFSRDKGVVLKIKEQLPS